MDRSKIIKIFPQKKDYPQNLKALSKSVNSILYRQLVESSASAYFETNPVTSYIFRKRFINAQKLFPKDKKKIKTTLDAGCGIGFFLPILSRLSKKVFAVDSAEHSLGFARHMAKSQSVRNVRFEKASLIDKLPFKSKQFDVIVCLSVLEHIKKLDFVVSEFKRVLKDEGVLIAGFPNEDNLIFRMFQYIEKRLLRPKVHQTFQGTKLIHVSKAGKIIIALNKQFRINKEKNITLFPGVDFYIIRSYQKN